MRARPAVLTCSPFLLASAASFGATHRPNSPFCPASASARGSGLYVRPGALLSSSQGIHRTGLYTLVGTPEHI